MPLDFGVEIECLIPANTLAGASMRDTGIGLAQVLSDAGTPCYFAGYTHAQTGSWKVVTDGSISGPAGYVGLEIVSPPLSDAGLAQVEQVCQTLIAQGARVNKSCGLHVHIGARTLSLNAMKNLAWLYHDYEESIDGLLPPSRRANNAYYARSVKATLNKEVLDAARDVQGIIRAINYGQRFCKLNFAAYLRHGTVEFRQHSGTVDPNKVTKWIILCQQMVDTAVATAGTSRRAPPPTDVALQRRLARARSRRAIYLAACRPEGVTRPEAQIITATDRPPSIRTAMRNLGVEFYRDGRRDGHSVYKIRQTSLVDVGPADTSLPAFLVKLGLTIEDAQFWRDRAALLAGGLAPTETEGGLQND